MLRHAQVIRIRGVVQGVGFRPFVYRVAERFGVTGWVRNGADGVEIHAEGALEALDGFARALATDAPPAARIASTQIDEVALEAFERFDIRQSDPSAAPTVHISPDLATCDDCLRELFDPSDRRYRYPYVNCTNCGPRYSIVTAVPYDRPNTTMADWPMCAACAREYGDSHDRRFHAQPIACPACGPAYAFERAGAEPVRGYDAFEAAARALCDGAIVALKGLGGYLLACDPSNATAVADLRERKYRKERPFALMARDLGTARGLVELDAASETALQSLARPIVLARARVSFDGVAPDNDELGIMLPSAPPHWLLFAAGAPAVLVATSANRSNEPIAFDDDEARASLRDIADAFLIGERRIARRIDDSVVRGAQRSTHVVRFARGYAPSAVARVPSRRPILALGADLKNTVALAVDGHVFVSQHIGDLEHRSAREACETTIADLCATYGVRPAEAIVVADAHPQYVSQRIAFDLNPSAMIVQHHRAHVASAIAEREAWDTPVVAFAFDGTGYGDDATIWGGEMLAGSVADGFERVAHLRAAALPGGDAAARFPEQAAAGYLYDVEGLPDLAAGPFAFGARYRDARRLVERNVRCFATTSMGRLFDTVAALLGFTRESTFEAQAAMWLEHVARRSPVAASYALPFANGTFDYRPLLAAIARDRHGDRDVAEIARGFHDAIVRAIVDAARAYPTRPVVCSGGVFANGLLADGLADALGTRVWLNRIVPANDGGIALGQTALAAFAT